MEIWTCINIWKERRIMINEHLELGVINTLRIDRDTEPGLFLIAQDEKDVLLPNQYVTKDMKISDEIDVFLYTDSQDRIVATTQRPVAMLNEYGFFEVVDLTDFGAFVNWGLQKDLFVPKTHQKSNFKVGEKRILYVDYDEKTHRLIGSERLTQHLKFHKKVLKPNQEVTILVMAKTPMGYKCIVNNTFEGMIFHNEIFEKIKIGQTRKAFLKVSRPDGKLDLSLQKISERNTDASEEKILKLLNENNGKLAYNYKSDAEDIKNIFSLSKKVYKRTLTSLIDAGKIEVKDSGIYLK